MRVVIAGGSVAGLSTALMLARAGHEILVLDADPLTPAADVESAAELAFRAAAPQIVQPHALLPQARLLLRERLADVYDALLAAGAIESVFADQLPPSFTDRSSRPGDEQLTMVMTRRSTLDWVLLRIAAAEQRLCLHGGVRVTGLLTRDGAPPAVIGVQTTAGNIRADLVVDASGRRSRIDHWLSACGARPAQRDAAECGLAYFSRHYRRRARAALPGPAATRLIFGLDEFTAGIWAADNDTMLLALAPMVADRRFRTAAEPEVFTAALRTIPVVATWLDALDPIGPVHVMGGLHNTMRRIVVNGEPVATGLLAVGDSVCTTNPTLGRGVVLALQGAVDVTETIAAARDPRMAAIELDDRISRGVQPFYDDQVSNDAARLAALRHAVLGEPALTRAPASPDRVDFAQLRAAAMIDPLVFRAFCRLLGMLDLPETFYADAELAERVRRALEGAAAVSGVTQPARHTLEDALVVSAQSSPRRLSTS